MKNEMKKILFSKEEQYAMKEIVADLIENLKFAQVAEDVRKGKVNPAYALNTIKNWVRNPEQKQIINQMIYKLN